MSISDVSRLPETFTSSMAKPIAVVEACEHLGRDLGGDAVGDAVTDGAGLGHEGDDPAGRLGQAAVIRRALPEAPRPALDARGVALAVDEVGAPYQRAVSEQPDVCL